MDILYLLVMPLVMIVLPTITQIILTRLRLKHKTKIPIWLTFILTLVLGSVMAFAATMVSTHGFPVSDNPNEGSCATGAASFLFLGLLLTATATPIIGLVGGILYRKSKFDS